MAKKEEEKASPTAPLSAPSEQRYEVVFTAISDVRHELRRQGEIVSASEIRDLSHLLGIGAIRVAAPTE